jgi:hypothetical protein
VNEEGKVRMKQTDYDEIASEINVFPNPAQKEVTLCGLKVQTEYDVCIYNSLGVAVWEHQAQTNLLGECVVTVADWPVGIYFVRLTNATENIMVKFVKR